jgi:hypothetical protein
MKDLPVVEAQEVGDAENGDIEAKTAHEALVRTESQPPHPGPQPVGADDQIEAASRRVNEGDVDAALILTD